MLCLTSSSVCTTAVLQRDVVGRWVACGRMRHRGTYETTNTGTCRSMGAAPDPTSLLGAALRAAPLGFYC